MTTPIAIDVSKTIGGIPALTTAAVILTGMLGATFNHKLLKLFGIKNDIAAGLAIGASSHAIGTSKALEIGPLQGAMSSVSLCVCGIITSVLVLFL